MTERETLMLYRLQEAEETLADAEKNADRSSQPAISSESLLLFDVLCGSWALQPLRHGSPHLPALHRYYHLRPGICTHRQTGHAGCSRMPAHQNSSMPARTAEHKDMVAPTDAVSANLLSGRTGAGVSGLPVRRLCATAFSDRFHLDPEVLFYILFLPLNQGQQLSAGP